MHISRDTQHEGASGCRPGAERLRWQTELLLLALLTWLEQDLPGSLNYRTGIIDLHGAVPKGRFDLLVPFPNRLRYDSHP